jgi:hypothetical protein
MMRVSEGVNLLVTLLFGLILISITIASIFLSYRKKSLAPKKLVLSLPPINGLILAVWTIIAVENPWSIIFVVLFVTLAVEAGLFTWWKLFYERYGEMLGFGARGKKEEEPNSQDQ